MASADGPIELANRLRSAGQFANAIAVLRSALAARADFLEAHFNLAILLQQTGDFAGAEREYRTALRLRPGLVEAMQGLAGVLLETGRSGEALPLLRRIVAEKGPSPLMEYALGRALGMENRLEEALAHNQRALALNPADPAARIHRGELLEQLDRSDEAIGHYEAVLREAPGNIEAHVHLNALLYRLKRDDTFLRSFDRAPASPGDAALLLVAKAGFLMRAGRHAEAEETYARALSLQPANLSAAMGRAAALSGLADFRAAIPAFERAIALQPDDANVLTGFAATLLRAREPARAEAAAGRALTLRPFDQTALALLSLSWRAQADERDETLSNYRQFVRVMDLEPPDGFSDFASFHAGLDEELNGLYRDNREHIDQTLRGGTRAAASKIFGAGYQLVERLRARIDEAVKRYISEMPDGDDHPFLGRRSRAFAYSGSWSSRLHDCGFHLNHVHPAGWISSAYYVAVPDRQPNDPVGGQLKFGEPPWDIGLADPVTRIIEPVPGRLVLFPSYLWHGTIPFHGPQTRTTIAFDVLPLSPR